MPQRINIVGDLGTTKIASDSYDIDNIYLTEEGWVYRHWKTPKDAASPRWWDEIIVAGEVPASDTPSETNPPKLGTIEDAPYEGGGDDLFDYEYSPLYDKSGNAKFTGLGGGTPFPDGTPTPPDSGTGGDGTVEDSGEITYNRLGAGGTGYSTGAANLLGGSGSGATINIDTVDAGGAILTYTLTDGGQGYDQSTLTVDGGNGDATIYVTKVFAG